MMIRITDNAPAVLRDSGFVYRAPANPEDIAYTYNRNGAMISDYHRRVEIEYNLLNLPQRVTNTMDTTKSIAYSYDSRGGKLRRQAMDGGVVTSTVDYAGNKLYTDGTLSKVLIPGGYINVSGSQASYMFFATDHLGSVRQVLDSNGAQQEQNDYYPFGMQQRRGGYLQTTTNKYKYNGKEQDKFGDFTTLDYGARFYDPAIARWNTVDPLAHLREWVSPYNFVQNNPIKRIDPTGALDDWVESADGEIYWDENATSQATTKEGETYLGKNVLVGTHNRDASGNEEINTAQFDLYLESDKTGPSATIMGNTVPADIEKYGTVAEGLYPAEYSIYKGDGAILINGGGNLPTVSGNPNNRKNYNADGSLKPISEHVIDEVFFHKGNFTRKSLSTSSGSPISAGCQTGGCGPGTLPRYREFIKNAEGFNGSYYLRAKPVLTVPKIVPFSSKIKGGN